MIMTFMSSLRPFVRKSKKDYARKSKTDYAGKNVGKTTETGRKGTCMEKKIEVKKMGETDDSGYH